MSEDLFAPENLEDLKGKPKRLYKLIKADMLTLEQLDEAQALGFPDVEFDPEDELHVQMFGAIKLSSQRIIAKQREEAEVQKQAERDQAREWLIQNHPEVPTAALPDSTLDEIYQSIMLQAHAEAGDGSPTCNVVSRDDDELVLVTDSGEIIGFLNAPHAEMERRNILEWVGERLTTSQAKQAGIEAEKQFWLAKIDKQYNPQINKQIRIQKQLRYMYEPTAKGYMDDMVAAHKGKTPLRSLKIGMLLLQLTTTKARVDVLDEPKAIAWAEEKCPDAVKTEKSIGKSLIPDAVKKTLTKEQAAESGIFWYPGGEDKFEVK